MLSNADDSGLMDLSSPSSSSTADAAKQPHENLEFQANQVLNAGWEESGASTRSSSRSKAANNSYNNSFANVFDYETTTTSASISNSNNSSRKRNHDNMSSSHTMTMPPQEEVAQSTQFGNQISALQEMLLQTTSVLQTVAHSVNELKKQQQIQLHALKDRQATEHALHSNNSSASSSPTNVPPNPQLQPSPPTATIAKPQKERKKKPRIEDSESKLALLKAENETLKKHVETVLKRKDKTSDEKDQQKEEMLAMLKNPNSTDSEIKLLNKNYTDSYSDFGKHRQRELGFHLQQLERLITPAPTTKMGCWVMEQTDQFFENTSASSLGGILSRELLITVPQLKKIQGNRESIRQCSKNLKESFQLLAELNSTTMQKTNIFADRMDKCQEILTPRQCMKLLLWVSEHENVINQMCPGWGSEHIIPETVKEEEEVEHDDGDGDGDGDGDDGI